MKPFSSTCSRRKIKNQGGFTAIELVIGVAIMGIIGAAIATTVTQVFSGSSMSNNQETAINNVRNAGDWIVRDAQQARAKDSSIVPADTDSGEFVPLSQPPDEISLVWYDYDLGYPTKEWHTVSYTIPEGTTNLIRTAGVGDQPIVIAQNITSVTRALDTTNDVNIFTVTITAEVGTGTSKRTETRTFEIRLRPKR